MRTCTEPRVDGGRLNYVTYRRAISARCLSNIAHRGVEVLKKWHTILSLCLATSKNSFSFAVPPISEYSPCPCCRCCCFFCNCAIRRCRTAASSSISSLSIMSNLCIFSSSCEDWINYHRKEERKRLMAGGPSARQRIQFGRQCMYERSHYLFLHCDRLQHGCFNKLLCILHSEMGLRTRCLQDSRGVIERCC